MATLVGRGRLPSGPRILHGPGLPRRSGRARGGGRRRVSSRLVRPYDSGPGRKWLFFVFGAGMFGFLALVGLRRGDPLAFQLGRAVAALGLLLAAIRAHALRVTADDDGVTVRTWASATRYAWEDVKTVFGTPERPVLVLRTGAEVVLLDNWHQDPSSVGAEVRRRLLASQDRTSR